MGKHFFLRKYIDLTSFANQRMIYELNMRSFQRVPLQRPQMHMGTGLQASLAMGHGAFHPCGRTCAAKLVCHSKADTTPGRLLDLTNTTKAGIGDHPWQFGEAVQEPMGRESVCSGHWIKYLQSRRTERSRDRKKKGKERQKTEKGAADTNLGYRKRKE